jgi:predicted RNA-binding Zn-ribbon protein involved in translation (DUF1610 family)
MAFRKWLARLHGTEICVIPGLYWGLVGVMPGTESLAIGLGVARVLIRWPSSSSPSRAPEVPRFKCPVCGEPIVEGEEVECVFAPLPTPPLAHAECLVLMQKGSVGCQRGQCPNCGPPAGQSVRDQARDAFAYYKASQGRRPKKGTAVS